MAFGNNSGFKTYLSVVEHIESYLVKRNSYLLNDSKMKIHVSKSKSSNSHYIVLSYKNLFARELDPLYGKAFPLTIRVSDHKIYNPYSKDDANYDILVRREMHIRDVQILKKLRARLLDLRRKIYLTTDSEVQSKIIDSIRECEEKVRKINNACTFYFEAELKIISKNIKEVLLLNKK